VKTLDARIDGGAYFPGPNGVKRLGVFVGGKWARSRTDLYSPVCNASTGEVIVEAPRCTVDEVNAAVASAKKAFEPWRQTPVQERVQVLFRFKALLDAYMNALATICATENGKTHAEAVGDVERGREIVEFACGAPTLMMGESLENVSRGLDVVTWRQPLGVCAGIVPFNFPAMIPMWMFPISIACGNTFVLKAASMVPNSAARLMELLQEAGLPDGVVNMITCGRESVKLLLEHPDVKAVSFVGSTGVGREVYRTAAGHGKRVQALTEAKNHALVMPDCVLPRAAQGVVNAAFGCAGERCMALPTVVVLDEVADELIRHVVDAAKSIRVGHAEDPETTMGPLISSEHREVVVRWIETGVREGAKLVLDGRGLSIPEYPNGFYLGPTIFDHVTEEMSVGREEIFGPVLCIKRVKTFKEGIDLINSSRFGNGSAIYTQSGRYAREFAHGVGAGMVGVNVGIPVPLGFFSFTGWKQSFFGDMHSHGKDGVLFYTEKKSVSYRWFEEADATVKKVGTWD
jgi:malonate-semialdehyde dehydrogenase (acetylating)/methylmalonate-semialdehyde dehydrogenase